MCNFPSTEDDLDLVDTNAALQFSELFQEMERDIDPPHDVQDWLRTTGALILEYPNECDSPMPFVLFYTNKFAEWRDKWYAFESQLACEDLQQFQNFVGEIHRRQQHLSKKYCYYEDVCRRHNTSVQNGRFVSEVGTGEWKMYITRDTVCQWLNKHAARSAVLDRRKPFVSPTTNQSLAGKQYQVGIFAPYRTGSRGSVGSQFSSQNVGVSGSSQAANANLGNSTQSDLGSLDCSVSNG